MVAHPWDIVFPSDLETGATPAGEFVLAGRLVGRDERTNWIADAMATAQVRGELVQPLGSLVKLRVVSSASGLVMRELIGLDVPQGGGGDEQARLIDQRVGTNLRARARALATVRDFFAARRFVEVETPVVVPSPGLDLHLDAIATSAGYLTTSPEYQMKRLLVGGMPRIFQVAHVFRAGELGQLHNPEFAMLEWYRAFAGVESVMHDTEQLVVAVAQALSGRAAVTAAPGRSAVDLQTPFTRLTVAEAFARFAGVGPDAALLLAEQSPDAFYRLLVERVEPALAQWPSAVFLVDYPMSQASLARAKPGDPRVCERFELYIAGVEVCNGFGELTDVAEQRRRLLRDQQERAQLGKTVYPLDQRFLDALAEGMPPSAGNALGLDRLIALCLGETSIARVMSFPAPLL